MKTTIAVLIVLLAGASMAKGLACGYGAMSPMEARLERTCGNTDATSTRIQNTMRASTKGSAAVAEESRRQYEARKEEIRRTGCCGKGKAQSSCGTCKSGTCKRGSCTKKTTCTKVITCTETAPCSQKASCGSAPCCKKFK